MYASEEIARETTGDETRSVRLGLQEDGALVLDAQDTGPIVRAIHDDGDYEFWVRVPREAVAALALALLKEKYLGRVDAVDDLRDFCARYGVAHRFGIWS